MPSLSAEQVRLAPGASQNVRFPAAPSLSDAREGRRDFFFSSKGRCGCRAPLSPEGGQRMPETCAKALRGASMQGKVVLRAGMTRVCLTYRLLPAGSPLPRVGSSMGSGPFRPTSTLRNGEKKARVKDGTGTHV